MTTIEQHDSLKWDFGLRVQRFDLDQIEATKRKLGLQREPLGHEMLDFCRPDSDDMYDGNLLTTLGLARLANLLIGKATWVGLTGNGATGLGRIGVGNSATAAVVGDTDLNAAAGSTNRQFVKFDSVATVLGGLLTFVATFDVTLANFTWAEAGIDGGAANGTTVQADAPATAGLINHKVQAMGTKVNTAAWVASGTIVLS